MIARRWARRSGLMAFLAGMPLLWLPSGLSAAPPGDKRTHLPDHRLGPLSPGKTNEKEAIARLGEGLRFPTEGGTGHCWSEERRMLCAAFEKGRLSSLLFQKDAALPKVARRFLQGPDGKKPLPPDAVLGAKMQPNIFLASLATETGLRIDSTEREVLGTLGSPHSLVGATPPFRFIYRSSRENDPACPARCVAVYTLSKEHLVSIYLGAE